VGIVAWLLLGAIAAYLERRLLPPVHGTSFLGSMALGWAGAALGSLFSYGLGFGEFTGLNVRSFLIASAGVVMILTGFRLARSVRAG
jgi:uncharacterized membrane protein YeaQ/YmgE (transglycosylase-associated protein family)